MQDDEFATIWKALADPTRRRILDLLHERPRTTGQTASEFDISRIAIMRHLRVLSEAGLVVDRKRGRERWHYINIAPLLLIQERWFDPLESGWVSRLSKLKRQAEIQGDVMTDTGSVYPLSINLAQEFEIDAPANQLFRALTEDPAAWWGHPYLTSQAIGLTLDPQVGGAFREVWNDNGGRLLATVSAIAPGQRLELTGPFHFGIVFGVATFQIEAVGSKSLLQFSHQAIGAVDEEQVQRFAGGWSDLLSVRLKAFAETGARLGIAP